MTALERIKEIEDVWSVLSRDRHGHISINDEGFLAYQFDFLIKAFKVMREIALESWEKHWTDYEDRIIKKFEERMKDANP